MQLKTSTTKVSDFEGLAMLLGGKNVERGLPSNVYEEMFRQYVREQIKEVLTEELASLTKGKKEGS
jgi:hypothetical protein